MLPRISVSSSQKSTINTITSFEVEMKNTHFRSKRLTFKLSVEAWNINGWKKWKKRGDNDFSQPRKCNLDSAADGSRLRAHGWGDLGLETLCLLITYCRADRRARLNTPVIWAMTAGGIGAIWTDRQTVGPAADVWGYSIRGRCWDVHCHRKSRGRETGVPWVLV